MAWRRTVLLAGAGLLEDTSRHLCTQLVVVVAQELYFDMDMVALHGWTYHGRGLARTRALIAWPMIPGIFRDICTLD